MTANEKEPAQRDNSLLDALGWRGLWAVVWHATPWPWRMFTLPYGVMVYRRLLANSDTLQYLREMHRKEYDSSLLFRLFRPRYHRVARRLKSYGIGDAPKSAAPPDPPQDRRNPLPPLAMAVLVAGRTGA
ncbi:MAG: hypothetical protein FJ280_10855 [Planctomycetes bacterium]|nr:hypothetical protein [Planctomycetota bacterium]